MSVIQFNEIPYTKLKPGTFIEARASYDAVGAFAYPTRVLIIGQMLVAGTATANRAYPIFAVAQATALFGAGSTCEAMARFWLLQNPQVPMEMAGMADAVSAVKASGTIAYTGAPTAAGVEAVYVCAQQFQIPVATTDTPTTIATAIVAALNAAVPTLPVVATSAVGTVTLTARNAGTAGNAIDFRRNFRTSDTPVPGLAATITAMASGAISPDPTAIYTALAGVWYTDIVLGWTDATVLASAGVEMARRYVATAKLDCHCWAGLSGSYSTNSTTAASLNSGFMTQVPVRNPLDPPWAWAAAWAGTCIPPLTNDPARQLRGRPLLGLTAPADTDIWIDNEQEILLAAGLSTFDKFADGSMAVQRVVTNNKTTASGIATGAWRDVMRPKTVSRIRYDWGGYFTLNWGDSKLTDDGSLASEMDPTVATPKRLKASWSARCLVYGAAGWIENIPAMIAQAQFSRDGTDPNRVNARQPIQIVGNMMVLAAALEFQA